MQYPFISQYGAVTLPPDAVYQPDPSLHYKVLFDVRETANNAREINQGLDHIAKLFNLLAPAGIKPDDTEIVAIFHGPAVVALLNNQAYQEKFGMDNPNGPLIEELTRHGVRLYACAQALAKQDIPHAALNHHTTPALSSLTVMIDCQLRHFAYVPFN
jgi:intracellular sulfur oxidation DsrE/DsrF family protein